MSRYFNEVFFQELEKEQRTGVPSKWIQDQEEDGDRGEYGDE